MLKVSVQLQSLSEVSLCPGQQGASQMTELEDESWDGWTPRLAGFEMQGKRGEGWGMGGVVLVVPLKPL